MASDRDDPDDERNTARRPTAAERKHHERTYPRGVPIVAGELPEPDPDDTTSPYDLPIETSRRDAESVRRADRDPSLPVMPTELSAIAKALSKHIYAKLRKEMEDSAEAQRRELGQILDRAPRDVAELLNTRLDKMDERQDAQDAARAALEREFAPHQKFGKWVAGIAFTALLAVGAFLYHRGAQEQLVTDLMQHLGDRLTAVENRLNYDHSKEPRP